MTDHELNELKHRVEGAHRAVPGAYAPAADVWQRARSQVSTNQKREEPIMSMTPTYSIPSTPGRINTERNSNGLSRFVSMAATLAIVGFLAFGGWFAATNLPPTNNGQQFALMQATPTAAMSCDVESLTVDEVMLIVKNPYAYFATYVDSITHPQNELLELPYGPTAFELEMGERTKPAEVDFNATLAKAETYLDCLPTATWGQLWALSDPFWVQHRILTQFPVFATEAEVEQYVTSMIDQPLATDHNPADDVFALLEGQSISVNPDIDDAKTIWPGGSSGLLRPIIEFGIQVTDDSGEIVVKIDSEGNYEEWQPGSSRQRPRILVGQSMTSGEWFVIPWSASFWMGLEY